MDNNIITTIQALLKGRNPDFDASKKVKLVRHQDTRKPKDRLIQGQQYEGSLYQLYRNRNAMFLDYQREQKHRNFDKVEYIVSFIGEANMEARFVGVFKNNGIEKELTDDKCLYNFQEIKGFEVLKERTIIDWGASALGWHQWMDNNIKPVIRIDRGFNDIKIPVFTSYNDVMLDYETLHRIFQKQDEEWKSKLEACNCVYLILDKLTGKQYVGVTYNKSGIWGRWAEYAKDGHGNDKDLMKLIDQDPNYGKENFQWCILETLPINVLPDYAIDRESIYKEKLGTRQFGYNNN